VRKKGSGDREDLAGVQNRPTGDGPINLKAKSANATETAQKNKEGLAQKGQG